MSNNSIAAAVKALKKKNGEALPYRVYFKEEEMFYVDVEAKTEQEAVDLAREEMDDGNYQSNGSNGFEYTHYEELESKEAGNF